jgi:hypothetical protein
MSGRAFPHKRLLKELPLSFALGVCQTLGNVVPLGECLRQALRGEDSGAEFTQHVLGLTPSAPSCDPIGSPISANLRLELTAYADSRRELVRSHSIGTAFAAKTGVVQWRTGFDGGRS